MMPQNTKNQSVLRLFKDTNTSAKDYDGIFTGDLGTVGSELLIELAKREGYDLTKKHKETPYSSLNKGFSC